MSTPRQIKASEVVKGMRVRWEHSHFAATVTTEGVVTQCTTGDLVTIWIGAYRGILSPDHPVTVLAEPEPEWVEGAWYRCQVNMTGDGVKLMRRGVGGWTSFEAGPWTYQDTAVTVLGRVLIVDWPGDDVAREVAESAHWYHVKPDGIVALRTALADAIRTQGGAR